MKKATTLLISGLLLSSLAATVVQAITIDGVAEGAYGAAVSTQTTQTGFGDSGLGQIDYANGSEIDGAYALVYGGVLYVTITGNLESNFNKLELFIDSKAGGQNQLLGSNPNVDFNGLNRMSELKVDAGFAPDYWFSCTGGGGPYTLYANGAELLPGGGGAGGYMGQTGAGSNGVLSGGSYNVGVLVTINNLNTGGVNGGCGAASGAGVTTGVEWAIPMSLLGNTTGCLKISAFINGGGHDYLANQVADPLPPGTCNLGEPHVVDFSQIAGNQYFQICDQATPANASSWGHLKSIYR